MRTDKLSMILSHIKEKTPRFFYKYCTKCKTYVKKEPMWCSTAADFWTCKRCAPTLIDFVRCNPRTYDITDFRPLFDDEARRKRNEALGIPDADV